MGIYSEYLDRQMNFAELAAERKQQLARIAALRGRDVLVFAADLQKTRLPIDINYSDLLPIHDQLSNLKGTALDLILETPGGSGETAEDIVKLLRAKYDSVAVIVPGVAKSAATIMTMAADEILMEPASALGPIDAQIVWQGKRFSAHALLQGMQKIKDEVVATNALNRAYIPILQNISPGELQHAQNSLDFATELVTEWLTRYKFRDWTTHGTAGRPVTIDEKRARAKDIADQLSDHGRWKTHGRSIKLEDLRAMRLRVTDYSERPDLRDAIGRYYTLLQMTFAANIYKLFETPVSQIMRLEQIQGVPVGSQNLNAAVIGVACRNCGAEFTVQASFAPAVPLKPGAIPFPAENKVRCPQCGTEHDLSEARRQIEAQAKRPILNAEGAVDEAV